MKERIRTQVFKGSKGVYKLVSRVVNGLSIGRRLYKNKKGHWYQVKDWAISPIVNGDNKGKYIVYTRTKDIINKYKNSDICTLIEERVK